MGNNCDETMREPKSDVFNNNLYDDSEARKFFDNLMTNGDVEQEESADMQLPAWYDDELCKKGQSFYHTFRLVVVSGMLSGLIAVLAIPSILQVLICTRQSGNAAMAYKRYVETIMHVISWHTHPLKPGTKAWESVSMVRRGHYKASKKCLKAKSGKVTQRDLALTQFGFFGYICLGAERVGILGTEFQEATTHLWRVIGHLMGIRDEFNLCTDSWATTKPRLELVVREVFKPNLENPGPNFVEMTKALIDGLWPINTLLTYGSYMYFTKRMSRCEGYEFFDFDFPNGVRPKNAKSHFYDLSWWDRFVVAYGLFLVTYLYPFRIVRLYLNFRVWLDQQLMHYLPYVAILKFGPKWAYVRIFRSGKEHKLTNGYHHE